MTEISYLSSEKPYYLGSPSEHREEPKTMTAFAVPIWTFLPSSTHSSSSNSSETSSDLDLKSDLVESSMSKLSVDVDSSVGSGTDGSRGLSVEQETNLSPHRSPSRGSSRQRDRMKRRESFV